jgi:antitoxin HicB
MKYPVTILEDGNGYMATFADIPEALTAGDTYQEALDNAADALVTAFEFYFEDGRKIPLPAETKAGEFVTVPVSLWSKVLLLNAMVENKVTQAALAEKMGLSKQSFQRIVDVRHATKIDMIDAALNALGKRLELTAA